MAAPKHKFQMYKKLQVETQAIYAEAKKAAESLKMPAELKGAIGLTGAISGCPAPLREDLEKVIQAESKKVVPLGFYVDQIREIIKDIYGDDYDAAPISTCEAGLWVSIDSLFTPPLHGRGDNYRARYILPLERHTHHHGGYGRPFPPKYKDILADRGSTSGELGFSGKRQNNLDTVIVPMEGAEYPVHGIKYYPVPLMKNLKVKESLDALRTAAQRNETLLSGFASLGYDTPGYGYGDREQDGTPKLSKGIAQIAREYNVPYIIDNAWGLPLVGTSIKNIGADVMIYSIDKAPSFPHGGLIIGKEDAMVPIRRAMGLHGNRYGTTGSYGKAAYVGFDPGKESLSGMAAALRLLRDNPKNVTKTVDDLYDVVTSEFAKIDSRIKPFFQITKSYNSCAVEINYEESWKQGKLGIPIFSIEDMYAGSNLFQDGLTQMGIIPTIGYDANIFISPGLGTSDSQGQLIQERAQMVVRGLVMLIEIVCAHSGIFEQ